MIHARVENQQRARVGQAFIDLVKKKARAQKLGMPPKTCAGMGPPGAIV
jgi:hypothetical protein